MKTMKKLSAVLMTLMLCLGMMTTPVWASSMSQDGLEVSLLTDKEVYDQGEDVQVTLTVTNTNEVAVTNVSLEHIIPDGYKLADGDVAASMAADLEAGETTALTVTYVAETSDGNNQPVDKDSENGNTNTGTTPTSNKVTTTPTSSKTTSTSTSKVRTGDESRIAFWVILFCVAIVGVVVAYVMKKKKAGNLLSLFLCIAMAGACFGGNAVKTYGAETDEAKSIAILTGVTVAQEPLTLEAKVTYCLGDESSDDKSTVFDENDIQLSFGAVSDVHINTKSNVSAERFANALAQLSAQADINDADGLDAVCVVGDLIDYACNTAQAQSFISTYEATMNGDEVPLIYTLGNHDISWGGATELEQIKWFATLFGEKYFEDNLTDAAAAARGDYHFEINGYHFVCITPMSIQPITYAEESKQWLEETLREITSENPEQFVYVLTHPMLEDTVYGSDMNNSGILGDFWATDDLTDILNKYPQAVTFGGHLHFPINDERSIMQTGFTSLGCGSVRYMAIENGGYEDMQSATVMNDNQSVSSGLLVQADSNGNMRITRMNFLDGGTIKQAWEISAPSADMKYLTKYTKARGNEENNAAPEMNGTAEVTFDNTVSGNAVGAELVFDAGTDDDLIHHYVITYGTDDSEQTTTKKILADFYLHNQVSDMKTSYTLDMGTLTRGKTYNISIYAEDSWGAQSNPLKLTVEVPGSIDVVEPEALQDAYVALHVSDGALVDEKNNVTLTNNGAQHITEEVTFNGNTVSQNTLHVNAEKECYIATFKDQETSADNKAFVEKGFTVEAFYVNRNPSGIQGVICGTQAGGWGLAENNGEPYFIAKFGTKYYSVYAGQKASDTELTHVVASYDPETNEISIYVNGEKMGRTKVSGAFVPGAGEAFNSFCIGADVGADRKSECYYMTNFSMVSGNIYNYTLSAGQVVTAYQNAVNALSVKDTAVTAHADGEQAAEKDEEAADTPEANVPETEGTMKTEEAKSK